MFYKFHKHELLLSKENVASSQILLLLKGFTSKLYGYFYSYLSVKREKTTNNNSNNNPRFKNRLADLNADWNTNPPNPPNPLNPSNLLNPQSLSNPPNPPSPLNPRIHHIRQIRIRIHRIRVLKIEKRNRYFSCMFCVSMHKITTIEIDKTFKWHPKVLKKYERF